MGKIIEFDDVSCGDFFVWLFRFAEEQTDEDFVKIHNFYDWLASEYLSYLNPNLNIEDSERARAPACFTRVRVRET